MTLRRGEVTAEEYLACRAADPVLRTQDEAAAARHPVGCQPAASGSRFGRRCTINRRAILHASNRLLQGYSLEQIHGTDPKTGAALWGLLVDVDAFQATLAGSRTWALAEADSNVWVELGAQAAELATTAESLGEAELATRLRRFAASLGDGSGLVAKPESG